jgi:hypothetical protein
MFHSSKILTYCFLIVDPDTYHNQGDPYLVLISRIKGKYTTYFFVIYQNTFQIDFNCSYDYKLILQYVTSRVKNTK